MGPNKDEIVDFIQVPKGEATYPRQSRKPAFYCNGCIFLRDRRLLEKIDSRTNCLGEKPSVVVMNDAEFVNIDTVEDFKFAEMLFQSAKRDKRFGN